MGPNAIPSSHPGAQLWLPDKMRSPHTAGMWCRLPEEPRLSYSQKDLTIKPTDGQGLRRRSWRRPRGRWQTHFGVVLHLRSQQFEVDAAKLSIPLTQMALPGSRKKGGVNTKDLQVERCTARTSFFKECIFFLITEITNVHC